jgi:hypothetical protein
LQNPQHPFGQHILQGLQLNIFFASVVIYSMTGTVLKLREKDIEIKYVWFLLERSEKIDDARQSNKLE